MSRYLLTGATGFVGGRVAEALHFRGDEVRCLVRPSSDVSLLMKLGVQYEAGDLFDADWLRRQTADVDAVIHVAGLTSAFRGKDFLRVNCEATKLLADACASQPIPPRFLYVSSMAASGPSEGIRLESDEPAPVSKYGRSKLAGETVLRERAEQLPVQIVRPSIVFGRRDAASFTMFRAIHRTHIHASPGWKSLPISVIHVDDLVDLILRMLASDETVAPNSNNDWGRGVWFGVDDSEYPTYADFGRRIMKAMEVKGVVLPMGPAAMKLAALFNQFAHRLMNRPSVFNLDKVREGLFPWRCSGEKARRELGLKFPFSIDERLQQTVRWYRRHHWLPSAS